MKIKGKIKSENGAVQVIEATFLYPIAFMCIFFLLYVGLYMLQSITINSYAQKVALLAAREVSYPGYLQLTKDTSVYKTAAVEADYGGSGIKNDKGAIVKCTFKTDEVKTDAYRYWSSDPLDKDSKSTLTDILNGSGSSLVKNHSLLSAGNSSVNIKCENNVISQNIYVNIEQELMGIGLLSYFGIDAPKVSARAAATVSDSDELIRNTDFVIDVSENLAKKLGINIDKMKESIKKAKETIFG